MTCFHPLQALVIGQRPNGKQLLRVLKKTEHVYPVPDTRLSLPCGQCVDCRLERSRQWAVRCMHEAKCHDFNCFITLTYDEGNLPRGRSLDVADFQNFMRSFRKRVKTKSHLKKFGFNCNKIRYYHCGEYGEIYFRPHYHACIFGYDFPDKVFWKQTKCGSKLYRSKLLEELWPFGFSSIGDVTFESAAYVARYILKKVNGIDKPFHYRSIASCDDDGVLLSKSPEYTTMSRRPGIGSLWYDKFSSDVYPSDEVIVRGKQCRPPKFYDSKLELANPGLFEVIKASRVQEAIKFSDDNTPERLSVKEKVKLSKLGLYKRDVE